MLQNDVQHIKHQLGTSHTYHIVQYNIVPPVKILRCFIHMQPYNLKCATYFIMERKIFLLVLKYDKKKNY